MGLHLRAPATPESTSTGYTIPDAKELENASRRSAAGGSCPALSPGWVAIEDVGGGDSDDGQIWQLARHLFGHIDTEPVADLVLRVENRQSIVDYWLALFPVGAEVPSPFFVKPPRVLPLELGKAVSGVVDPADPSARELWYATQLEPTDYRLTATFERADGRRANVMADVDLLGPLGQEVKDDVCSVNEVDRTATCSVKVSLAESTRALLRVRAKSGRLKAKLTIEPWPE